jgi:hypothetical protein
MKDARRVAMLAGISVADALAGNIRGTTKDLGWFNEDDLQADEPFYSRDQRDREAIKLELSNYLISNRDSAPSLQQIADKLQVSKGYLYYHFKELAALIVGNHAAWDSITQKDQQRLARWHATLHFLDPEIEDDLKIRKKALAHLQSTTRLPKQKLSEEINHVYEALTDYF